MIFIMGKRFYGRVDRVPGLFYVATSFVHLFWFPLIPLGTSIVLENSGRVTAGGQSVYMVIKHGLSFKSLLTAYLRAVLIVVMAVSALVAVRSSSGYFFMEETSEFVSPMTWGIAFAVFFGAFILHRLCRKLTIPGTKRALELGKKVGYPDEVVMKQLGIG